MIEQGFIKELTKIVGRENILSDKKDLIAYSYDATPKQEKPDVIVFPRSTAEVSAVVKAAHREKVPVIARGAGTNLSGGTIPTKGGIILEILHDRARFGAFIQDFGLAFVNLLATRHVRPFQRGARE